MAISKEEKDRIAGVFTGTCSQRHVCPVKDIMAAYGDKWTMYTVLLLGQHQKMRFNELRSGISGISQRMLTVTLRALEQDGILLRTIYPEVPPRVEYQLTEVGESLLRQLLQLAGWAEENAEGIIRSRKAYEIKNPE